MRIRLRVMQKLAHGPAHWRRRAEDWRKAAEQLERDAKMMLEIVQSYERLATLAEEINASSVQKKSA